MANVSSQLWSEREFGGCDLGDARRVKRLVKMASGLAENVGCAVSSCCGRMSAQLISRFFDRDEVTADSVLEHHIENTANRCVDSGLVLAIQDTTFLDFTGRKDLVDELGPIGPASDSRGLLMHSVLAVSPDKTPLGLLGMQLWSRDPDDFGSGIKRRKRVVSDKESGKWIEGLRQAEAATLESQALLVVGDRESDVFALFAESRRENTDILVRANQNRSIVDAEHSLMLGALDASDELGSYELSVPRQGSRSARTARLVVQACEVEIKPPRHRTKDISDKSVKLNLVRVREIDQDKDALEWILITSLGVNNLSDARKVIDFYSLRWVIEEFHKVLKSGCRIEQMQFETADRLKPAIALLSVVALRVLHLTKVSRQHPDADAAVLCSETEQIVLERWMVANNEKHSKITTAADFVRAVAILGGFMARKCDGNPGTKVIWQGLRRLENLVEGYKLATSLGL
jgi:hypothetical protein